MVKSAGLPGTVHIFLTILGGRLTRYDAMLGKNESKRGRPNIYRLGLFLEALHKVEDKMRSKLTSDDPADLNALKVELSKAFHVNDMPPVKKIIQQIDEYLEKKTPPKYMAASVVNRFLGFETVIKTADATDSLIAIQDALKDNDASGLKKALGALNGLSAGRALAAAMKRTGTKPAEVVKLLGDIH